MISKLKKTNGKIYICKYLDMVDTYLKYCMIFLVMHSVINPGFIYLLLQKVNNFHFENKIHPFLTFLNGRLIFLKSKITGFIRQPCVAIYKYYIYLEDTDSYSVYVENQHGLDSAALSLQIQGGEKIKK